MLVIIDDLGYADIQPHNKLSPTPHIGMLAASGVELANMHAYKVCSPSRRSLLSGRFPVHISGLQAPVCSNFLPLQMTLLPAKLRQAGFRTHFIGKGHLGSVPHPRNHPVCQTNSPMMPPGAQTILTQQHRLGAVLSPSSTFLNADTCTSLHFNQYK